MAAFPSDLYRSPSVPPLQNELFTLPPSPVQNELLMLPSSPVKNKLLMLPASPVTPPLRNKLLVLPSSPVTPLLKSKLLALPSSPLTPPPSETSCLYSLHHHHPLPYPPKPSLFSWTLEVQAPLLSWGQDTTPLCLSGIVWLWIPYQEVPSR